MVCKMFGPKLLRPLAIVITFTNVVVLGDLIEVYDGGFSGF
jgi:hypothetical protein